MFDSDTVLDAARRVFHERGYEGASVQALADATGLSRSSLYATFGDKRGLFLAVLDRYAEAAAQALLAEPEPRRRLFPAVRTTRWEPRSARPIGPGWRRS